MSPAELFVLRGTVLTIAPAEMGGAAQPAVG